MCHPCLRLASLEVYFRPQNPLQGCQWSLQHQRAGLFFFSSGALMASRAKLFCALQSHRTHTHALFSFCPGKALVFLSGGSLLLFMFLANTLLLYENPLLLSFSMDRGVPELRLWKIIERLLAAFLFFLSKEYNLVAYLN